MDTKSEFVYSESTNDVSPALRKPNFSIAFPSLPKNNAAEEEMKEQNASDESDDEKLSEEPKIYRHTSFQAKPLFSNPNPELEKNC
jgi:hypothetical protein